MRIRNRLFDLKFRVYALIATKVAESAPINAARFRTQFEGGPPADAAGD